MTRFEREIYGLLGEFLKKDAQKKVDKVKSEFESGKITVDENGVARNCIGRILMDDLAEVLEYSECCEWFSREATANERERELVKTINEYKESCKNKERSEEELFEMRATFGRGTTVVDILTGEKDLFIKRWLLDAKTKI